MFSVVLFMKKYAIFPVGLIVLLLTFALLGGCTDQQPAPPGTPAVTPSPTPSVTPGLANPASVYCGEVGGETTIMKNPDGSEYGVCVFPNGTACEEWALFRGEGCKPGA